MCSVGIRGSETGACYENSKWLTLLYNDEVFRTELITSKPTQRAHEGHKNQTCFNTREQTNRYQHQPGKWRSPASQTFLLSSCVKIYSIYIRCINMLHPRACVTEFKDSWVILARKESECWRDQEARCHLGLKPKSWQTVSMSCQEG